MRELLEWLRRAPPSAIPIVTAVVAAIVALVVAVLTQWILGRRARTELLTKKLEELYLLLLHWMDDTAATKIQVDELVMNQPLSAEQRSRVLELYAQPRADRRISMYIDLYFPRLKRFGGKVFEANRDFSKVIRLMGQGEMTTALAIERPWVRLSHTLSNLRREIVANGAYLIRRGLLRLRYKEVTIDEDHA